MAAAARRVSVVALGALLGASCLLLRCLLRRRSAFDGLDSLVSFSSRLIAAARAMEAGLADAFVRDPLAALFAGRQAMQRLEAKYASLGSSSAAPPADGAGATAAAATAAAGPGAPARPISRIIMRTLFMDDAVLTASASPSTQEGAGEVPAVFRGLQAALKGRSCTQVVLLGSGMDSRPWRLKLRPGVSWFEVDRSDVLAAKTRLLKRAGAALTSPAAAAEGGGREHAQTKYPLCCDTWAGVDLDLEEAGWSQRLLAAGFHPQRPTVWVLEGLLYYLEPRAVPVMLQEAASVSAPGSVLVASIVSSQFVEDLKGRDLQGPGGSLMSTWKWGCPGEPGEYFGASGWRVLSHPTWLQTCEGYGFRAEQRAAKEAGKAAAAEVTAAAAAAGAGGKQAHNVMYLTAILRE